MDNQPSQRALRINISNIFLGLLLLTLVNAICPGLGIDPKAESGQVFYMLIAVMTAFMFPWLQVVEVVNDDSEDKTPKS